MRSRYVIREPLFVARDESASSYSDAGLWLSERERVSPATILERYYTDLYKHLIAALASFDAKSVTTAADGAKLQSLLVELLKVRSLLEREEVKTH